jgi:glutamate 5-kinase
MKAYEELFAAQEVAIAQVLLTEDDFSDWRRYQNLRHTMEKLLKLGVLPIVNENDTVSTAELEYVDRDERVFSDNDRLAALLLNKLEAQAMILLTNVDGGLRQDPSTATNAEVIPLVTAITPELKALARGSSAGGRGGMTTKLEAAEIAMRCGGVAVIANGLQPDTLDRLFAGEAVGTAFIAGARLKGKRRWIAYAASVHGRLTVNDGARDAIIKGKASLLASGVTRIEDQFEAMEVVGVVDQDGNELARGIANCDSREAERLISSGQASKGRKNVLITRDNLVLLKQ